MPNADPTPAPTQDLAQQCPAAMTITQLEAEVLRLRAENARLLAVEHAHRDLAAEFDRLRDESTRNLKLRTDELRAAERERDELRIALRDHMAFVGHMHTALKREEA